VRFLDTFSSDFRADSFIAFGIMQFYSCFLGALLEEVSVFQNVGGRDGTVTFNYWYNGIIIPLVRLHINGTYFLYSGQDHEVGRMTRVRAFLHVFTGCPRRYR